MATIFERIVSGEIPCYKVAENKDFLAFLDVNPLVEGHVLVIPKKCTDYIFDMEEEEYAKLHVFAKHVARAIKAVVPCRKVGVAVVGLEVPHAHIHLIPMNVVADMNFANPKKSFAPELLTQIAAKISDAFKLAS